jgi:hypothetical protein
MLYALRKPEVNVLIKTTSDMAKLFSQHNIHFLSAYPRVCNSAEVRSLPFGQQDLRTSNRDFLKVATPFMNKQDLTELEDLLSAAALRAKIP